MQHKDERCENAGRIELDQAVEYVPKCGNDTSNPVKGVNLLIL
jgi:hypothetical protein